VKFSDRQTPSVKNKRAVSVSLAELGKKDLAKLVESENEQTPGRKDLITPKFVNGK